MKLVWTETDAGRTSLAIETTLAGEAAPFPRELILDTRLDVRPPDRLWVAAALAFGTRLTGTWDATTPVSTQVRTAISDYLGADIPFNPTVSEDAYQWYPGGGSALVLPSGGAQLDPTTVTGGATFVFEILELGDWAGRLYSIDRLITASNAYLLASAPGSSNPVGPYLGAAVLLATELHMDQLVLDRERFPTVDESWWDSAASLCASVGIDLTSTLDTPETEG